MRFGESSFKVYNTVGQPAHWPTLRPLTIQVKVLIQFVLTVFFLRRLTCAKMSAYFDGNVDILQVIVNPIGLSTHWSEVIVNIYVNIIIGLAHCPSFTSRLILECNNKRENINPQGKERPEKTKSGDQNEGRNLKVSSTKRCKSFFVFEC